jgi:hypothetical protein
MPCVSAKLQGSKFCTADDIAEMVKDFDKKAKHSFRKLNEPAYVKFGSSRDKDTRVGIRGGQLTLSGRVPLSRNEVTRSHMSHIESRLRRYSNPPSKPSYKPCRNRWMQQKHQSRHD